jgi:hypothetical protein
MIHLDLLTVAHQRRDELIREADGRGLAAAVRATRRQQEPAPDAVRRRRRFAASLLEYNAAEWEAGARER